MSFIRLRFTCILCFGSSEASSNLARYDNIRYGAVERRREGFGPEVKRRILMGSFLHSLGVQDDITSGTGGAAYVEAELAAKLAIHDALNPGISHSCISRERQSK